MATIGMQEKVIAKLQKVVEDHLKNSKSSHNAETRIHVQIYIVYIFTLLLIVDRRRQCQRGLQICKIKSAV